MLPTEILSTPVLETDLTFLIVITIKNVKSVSRTGVDRISVGSITHSAPAMDFKLEI